MRDLIGSPIVWVEAVTHHGKAARYIAKYCGKAPHRFGTCKRYWHSGKYNLELTDKNKENPWGDYKWSKIELTTDEIFRRWHFEGRTPQAICGKTLVPLGDGLLELVYWGVPPPSLRARWETPPDGAAGGASLGAAIAVPGCTAQPS